MALAGLSFATGLKLQEEIRLNLGLPVSNPALGRDSFMLVVAFGRCKFQLSPDSVGLMLQATIGGVASDFRVLLLRDHVFRFTVSCKPVGFFISRLISFECDLFKLSFHLWGNGGPNWRHELRLFQQEEESSWSKVPIKDHGNRSYADAVRDPPLTGANSVPMGRRSALNRVRIPAPAMEAAQQVRSPAMVASGQPQWRVSSQRWATQSQKISNFSANSNFCIRCLLNDHRRDRCTWPIRCHSCRGWGHVAQACMAVPNQQRGQVHANGDLPRQQDREMNKGKDTV